MSAINKTIQMDLTLYCGLKPSVVLTAHLVISFIKY